MGGRGRSKFKSSHATMPCAALCLDLRKRPPVGERAFVIGDNGGAKSRRLGSPAAASWPRSSSASCRSTRRARHLRDDRPDRAIASHLRRPQDPGRRRPRMPRIVRSRGVQHEARRQSRRPLHARSAECLGRGDRMGASHSRRRTDGVPDDDQRSGPGDSGSRQRSPAAGSRRPDGIG